VQDEDWDFDLKGAFSNVTVDKAHRVKNEDTSAHCVLRWLDAPFYVLATASVLPNSIADFDSLMSLVDLDDDLWTDANLASCNVSKDVNPYDLPENHPAAVPRYNL
jgi:hypothetical protein